ncbi:MAG: hypothetical protein IT305_27600 [Chloroflexi bacterium]|nr:hypothetical protein [Chloroflexota bacterium]
MRLKQFAVSALVALTATLPGPVVAQTQPQAPVREVYAASLEPLNTNVTKRPASGFALLTVDGDGLTVQVVARGLDPGTPHLQHIHGFLDSDAKATCPTAQADKNGDGIVDIAELVPIAGRTLIPLNQDPIGMMLLNPALFPTPGGPNWSYYYEQTVPIDQLGQAADQAFGVTNFSLDLDTRTIVVHGISPDATLPDSVSSVPGTKVPAQVTLPVACGALTRVQ